MQIAQIQRMLDEQEIDGWLFYDFRRSNPIAYRMLELPDDLIVTRRWYYFVPRTGTPTGLVSALEPKNLDGLPGQKLVYRTWQERAEGLRSMLPTGGRIAMEYSALNAIPYVSLVDAGTIELVRSLGVDVVSSADLAQSGVVCWTEWQWQSHQEASRLLMEIKDRAFGEVARRLRAGDQATDFEIQQFMWQLYQESGLVADDPPIVATNERCSHPHYLPTSSRQTQIQGGDVLLIDFWAKLDQPRAVYADHTWMGYVGMRAPDDLAQVFSVVAGARDRAISFVTDAFRQSRPIHGWEVDDVARAHIRDNGYEDYFIHRTGHNIHEEVHGEGANMDNFETHDERLVLPRTCFSIEPGIYLPAFGVRSEVDVFIDVDTVVVTGTPIQTEVTPILALS